MARNGGKIHNIHYGDILTKYSEIVSLENDELDYLTADGEAHAAKDYVLNGDIIIADTAEDEMVGKVVEVQDVGDSKVLAGLHTMFYRPPTNLFVRGWLGYWMNSAAYHNQLIQYMTGTKVLSLSKASLAETVIQYPSKEEQCQIVSALESVQKQILSLQLLLSKYESIKKATVKKLMTPSIGWETIPLGELCDDYGYGVSASATEFDGINKYIRITDIDDSSHKYLPAPLASPSFFTEKHIVHKGDILFARTGASVGKSYLYTSNDGRLIYAGFLIRMHIDSSKANPAFIFQQTLTSSYRQWVATESARTGQPGLNIEQYKKLILQVPGINIQNAIVSKLSAYDIMISKLNKTLKKLTDVKQAMLQYFFGD